MRTATATTLRKPSSAAHAKRALLARHHVVAPSLRVAEAAAGSVFGAARLRGPIARDVIAQVTQLSIATVNRQVTALLDAGVLRNALTWPSPAPSAARASRSRSTTSRI